MKYDLTIFQKTHDWSEDQEKDDYSNYFKFYLQKRFPSLEYHDSNASCSEKQLDATEKKIANSFMLLLQVMMVRKKCPLRNRI